jgi:hypothetical protein
VKPGLCEQCEHARKIESAKGSTFWRCGKSDSVPGWPKYPPIPVRRCPHFTPGEPR